MISIESSALHHMFKQVIPHMDDPENCMPVISSVRLEARDGWLYALATDRFTFAASRRKVTHDSDAIGHVPGNLVPAVAAWLDVTSQSNETVTISLPVDDGDDGPLFFTAPGRGKLTIEYDADDYKSYPDWRKIFHNALKAEPGAVPVSGVTTRFLARWPEAADKLMFWQAGPMKPVVFLDTLGYFAGMQMPFRTELADREDVAPAWIAATVPTAKVDGITYDLDKTWEDRHGDPWTYSGDDTPDGVPLMVIEGIEDDPHPLDRLIGQYGPLYARDL